MEKNSVEEICNRIIGPSLENLKKLTVDLATRKTNTLFVADTGAGKELFWQLFKAASPAAGKKLSINCASFKNEELLESALFGHAKGAFTGAGKDTKGILEVCNDGVLFLDEIGDASEAFQASLLRLRESQEFKRLGDNEIKKTNVCFVAATSKEEGIKRDDLKMAFQVVYIPSLRNRERDLPFLIRHFLKVQGVESISERALFLLTLRGYPGNVRELNKVIERAALIASFYGRNIVRAEHLIVTEEDRKHADFFLDEKGQANIIPVDEIAPVPGEEPVPIPLERFFEPFRNRDTEQKKAELEFEEKRPVLILEHMADHLRRIANSLDKNSSEADPILSWVETLLSTIETQDPELAAKDFKKLVYQRQIDLAGRIVSRAAATAGKSISTYSDTARRLGLKGGAFNPAGKAVSKPKLECGTGLDGETLTTNEQDAIPTKQARTILRKVKSTRSTHDQEVKLSMRAVLSKPKDGDTEKP